MTAALKMQAGNLQIEICETRRAMGEAAARCGVARAKEVIAEKGEANIIFAAAPSQFELYEMSARLGPFRLFESERLPYG